MRAPVRAWPVMIAWGLSSFGLHAAPTDSNDFAVTTSVAGEGQDRPIQQSTTLFVNPFVYDIVHGNPPEIARFDFQDQVVDLVSRGRRQRTRLRFADLLRFDAEVRARAERRKGLGAFLARPSFVKEIDTTEKTLTLSSPWLSYHAEVMEAPAEVVERTTAFADWSARLASMLSPRAAPAAARLELNAALKKQNWWASRVTRRGESRARQLGTLTSRHAMLQQLTDADRDIIRGIEENLESFPAVSFFDFRAARVSRLPSSKK